MKVTQLYTLINAVTKEVLGETVVVNEDLSNVIDIGKAVVDQQTGLITMFVNWLTISVKLFLLTAPMLAAYRL